MSELACTVANGCLASNWILPSPIPLQYQGWFMILFTFFGTIALLYVFYKISIFPDKEPMTIVNRRKK